MNGSITQDELHPVLSNKINDIKQTSDTCIEQISIVSGNFDSHKADMATQDKAGHIKLSQLPVPYFHPTTAGYKHIPSGGKLGEVLSWSSDGTAQWEDIKEVKELIYDNVTTIPFVTGYKKGSPIINTSPNDIGVTLDKTPSAGDYEATIVTQNPIDLTNFNFVQFEVLNPGGSSYYEARGLLRLTKDSLGYVAVKSVSFSDGKIITLPISDLTGSYYISFGATSTTYIITAFTVKYLSLVKELR
ncbi:hypothetical protein [Anaerovorax odorimutans]|uniref:hypothetical protein n=1 Tax=Anaerovorax odorimutans TaxID=109327 RepID=UPI00041282CC|nr:hypothetical protein [Anaerovorax odorimutans]